MMIRDNITELRRTLHRRPELSNSEFNTSSLIATFFERFQPDEVIDLASTGKAFVFGGTGGGSTIMFRAELDALPIREEGSVEYKSVNEGMMHACGHDGHMAILAALAAKIAAERPPKGRAVLLFQPAEEVEQGARDVVNDEAFKKIEPDYIFALHNMPGYEKGTVLLRRETFAAASRALVVKLHGRTSHAGEPEKGISPAMAVARIVQETDSLMRKKELFEEIAFLTIVHIRVGEPSAGTSPGYAEMMITLRAYLNSDMELLAKKTEELTARIASEEKLKVEMAWEEVFPAVVNHDEAVDIVLEAAGKAEAKCLTLDTPNRWSEDFAYFTEKYRGALFGLGAGEDHPPLHDPEYDFPDELLEIGSELFHQIYKKLLLTKGSV